MSPPDEVTLWRAPPPHCPDPEQEVTQGFSDRRYPGNGPYFATEKTVAEGFQGCYGNGIQEIHLPRVVFEDLVLRGVIQADTLYPEGHAWHVPAIGLSVFNLAMQQGMPNRYWPEDRS